jgi:VanZ family protein
MRQLLELTVTIIPKSYVSLGIWIVLFCAPLSLVFFIRKNTPRFQDYLLPAAYILIGILLAILLELPEERVHIIKYGLLGFLTAKDFYSSRYNSLRYPIIFCLAVGITDELFQSLLPYRVGDVRDVFFDSLSATLGALFYGSVNKSLP